MAHVFLLGPGEWRDGHEPSPLAMRLEIQGVLHAAGHKATLMEQEAWSDKELLRDQFDHIVDGTGITDALVLWPANARMEATFDEMLFLHERQRRGCFLPTVWLLHEIGVAQLATTHFRILEKGGRSAYLRGLKQLPMIVRPWTAATFVRVLHTVVENL